MPRDGERHSLSVSAVLPAYNEEAVIDTSIRDLARQLALSTEQFEIIVVNDGSGDSTGAVLQRVQATEPSLNLHVVTHSTNQGYGAALASGFDAASGQLVFFTDGDGQFDVAELADFLVCMDDRTDMVIGWRRDRADPILRLVNAWGWKKLVNGLFGYTAKDVDCAFKLFRREVWEAVNVRSRGATFSAELLIRARRLGFCVKERPVKHFARRAGSATGARPSVIARAFIELFHLWRDLDRRSVEHKQASVAAAHTAVQ